LVGGGSLLQVDCAGPIIIDCQYAATSDTAAQRSLYASHVIVVGDADEGEIATPLTHIEFIVLLVDGLDEEVHHQEAKNKLGLVRSKANEKSVSADFTNYTVDNKEENEEAARSKRLGEEKFVD